MMIPMISIDGISMPVNQDGMNLMSDMPLAAVAGQVLERGAAFEAAVEQFQQAMAEFPTPLVGTVPVEIPVGIPVKPAPATPPPVGTVPVEIPVETPVKPAPATPPPVGTVPVEIPVGTAPVEIPVAIPVEPAPATPPPVGTTPVEIPVKPAPATPPPVGTVPVDAPMDGEEQTDEPVLQAVPVAVVAEPQVIDVKNVAVEPVQVVAARVAHQVVATPAQVLIEAAAAVADTIVVSPGLLRGAGEVQVQLRPDVLEGTVIRIATTAPGTLTIQFTPVTENMVALLEKCAPQLATYLSERIHNVQIAVNVKRDDKLKG